MSAVKKMFVHPVTGKRMKRVYVSGEGWYSWNTAYHVYNSTRNYSQLQWEQIWDLDLRMSIAGEAEAAAT